VKAGGCNVLRQPAVGEHWKTTAVGYVFEERLRMAYTPCSTKTLAQAHEALWAGRTLVTQ
jgi:hypothetical protein